MNRLNKIQAEQKEWAFRNFGVQSIWKSVVGIQEEVGELSGAMLKSSQGIRRNTDQIERMKDAVGDISIFLMDLCNKQGWNLGEIIESTWAEVRERDWNKYPETGRPASVPDESFEMERECKGCQDTGNCKMGDDCNAQGVLGER